MSLGLSIIACIVARAAPAGLPAPPVKVAVWVGVSRPAQTHMPLLLGLFRSGDETTPRFLRWLGRHGRGLRVVAVDVLESEPQAALARLRRLGCKLPVGIDASSDKSSALSAPPRIPFGETAARWLPLAPGTEPPLVFLISNGRIRWYGNPSQAPDFNLWVGSREEARFWRQIADRESARKLWAASPVRKRVVRISAMIDQKRFAEAEREIVAFQSMPKTDWLDPAKFAPYLRLCAAEQERNVHGFYLAAQEISKAHETDAPMLNLVAWKIVDPHSRIPLRDWPLAVRLAKRATRLKPTSAGAYDTLAWALYGDHQTAAAIRAERRALWFSTAAEESLRSRNALKLFRGSPR